MVEAMTLTGAQFKDGRGNEREAQWGTWSSRVAINVAFGGKADMGLLHRTCPLMTQSGHPA